MTRALRIALPIHCLEPGGVERVGMSLASQWQAAGHRVTVVLGRGGGSSSLCSAPPLDYWSIATRWPTARFETPWMVHSLYSFLVQNPVDVLFCPGNTYAIVAAAIKMLLGEHAPPMVLKVSNALERRDMSPLMRRGYAIWLRAQGQLFDRAIALSEPMGREVRERLARDSRQLRVIPNPLLTRARLRQLGRIKREPGSAWATRYLAAGRLVPQKNLTLLIRAFSKAARPTDTLTIAGDGPERAALERLAAELCGRDQVRFIGHVASIDGLLASSDCLVLSSDYEGLPGVVVEALAASLPVLSTDCCVSMKSLVDHGRTGLLVPVGDEAALVQGLKDLRALRPDPERARRTAAQFEVESAADAHLELMRELVREREQGLRQKLALSALASSRLLDALS